MSGPGGPSPVLDGRALALRRLDLDVRRRLEGLLHGDHTGLRSGPGSEPEESRPYRPGQDDVRRMDWNVTARSLQPHVRSPLAERELATWVLVDASASMDFGTAQAEKRDLATAIVAAIGLLTDRPGNRLGIRVAYGDRLERIPARTGTVAIRHTLGTLLARPRIAPGEHPATDLAAALTRLRSEHRRPGLRVVVSDFLDHDHDRDRAAAEPGRPPALPPQAPAWELPLRRLAAGHDVIAVEVLDPRELALPDVGLLALIDPETGRRQEVWTGRRRLRERYAEVAAAHRDRNRAAFRRAGVDHLVLRTDRDWVRDVAAFATARRHAGRRRVPRRQAGGVR